MNRIAKLTRKLTTLRTVLWTTTAIVMVLVCAPTVAMAGAATNVFCGQVITTDTTLDGDLVCPTDPGAGLVIPANNVTLDLGGFTISSGPDGNGVLVRNGLNVTIRNGTIQGFSTGLRASNTMNLTLSNLIFKDNNVNSIVLRDGKNDVIEHSSFLLVDPVSAIHLIGAKNVDVNSIDIHGANSGVIFSDSGSASTGTVRNSTFTNTRHAINIFSTTDVKIMNNHFSNGLSPNDIAIVSSPFNTPPRSGIKIEKNFIHNYERGIQLGDVFDSKITGNQVRDCTAHGIQLFGRVSGSTNNVISFNLTSGNGDGISTFDLRHDALSSPNTWKDNSCETKSGADIPDC